MMVHANPAAQAPAVPFFGRFLIFLYSLIAWGGLTWGTFIGVYALSGSNSISIYLTLVMGFLVGIALCLSMFGSTGSLRRALAMDVFLTATGAVVAFAFFGQLRPHGPGIFMCVLAVFIVLVIVIAWRRPAFLSVDWLINLYNPEKAFGGATYGEFTSFLGVVGALGAHAALASDAQGWFWMGHFGTLLAFAASASLFWRWLRFEDDPVPAYLSLSWTFFALVSLALTPNLSNWYEFAVWALFILLTSIVLITVCVTARNLRSRNNWGAAPQKPIEGGQRVWLIIFTALVIAAGITYIVLSLLSLLHVAIGDITYGAMALNTAALLCWVLIEGWNVLQKRREPWNMAANYQEWEKNLWNIFGGATLIYFTLSPLWTGTPIPPESTYVFILGFVFGLLGTLRGVMLGMIKKYG